MKLLIENLKVRYEEFIKSRDDTQDLFADIKRVCSFNDNSKRLLYYIKDESGNKRLHHYCYDGIFISYYDPYVG
jgi:hypothetical protein